ncbi:MAG: DUF4126 family protein [Nitrosomonas sp.]|nr:MAG: DUF4126 family protein [Nitrosomonas sp.]
METYDALIATLALMMGVSWASGINLYAALFVLGWGGAAGHIVLPDELTVLQDPLVIGAAAIMYLIEFFVDKIPGMDSLWDSIHTFIRIPAGAMLAAGAVGDVTPALEIAAGVLGGGIAAASHATKAGTRLLINTSPEPVTNWSASLSGDLLVLSGLWAALKYPEIFLVLFIVFIGIAIWVLPKLWLLIKGMIARIGRFFGIAQTYPSSIQNAPVADIAGLNENPQITALERLQQLRDKGVLTEHEFEQQKNQILKNNQSQ